MKDFYVYLKLKKWDEGTELDVDTIPLRATNISISTDKTIPDFSIPFAGAASGESLTIALDLGMSRKRVTIQGFINTMDIKRSHTGTGTPLVPISRTFTAHEIAQLISSSVDSTSLAPYQAVDELVILIPSYVGNDYNYRLPVNSSNPTQTSEADTPLMPFTYRARGDNTTNNKKDNKNMILSLAFPDSNATDTATYKADLEKIQGLKGYVSNFNFDLAADTVEISFNMEFVVAGVVV